jgi:hypothetical protein
MRQTLFWQKATLLKDAGYRNRGGPGTFLTPCTLQWSAFNRKESADYGETDQKQTCDLVVSQKYNLLLILTANNISKSFIPD